MSGRRIDGLSQLFLPPNHPTLRTGIKFLKAASCGRPDSRISSLLKRCHLLDMVWWSLSLVLRVEKEGRSYLVSGRKMQT